MATSLTVATFAKYSAAFFVVIFLGYAASKFREKEEESYREQDLTLIRNFLLNDSPLYGYNKPKLWIHTKYEVNSRQWKSFYSRNTTDLNQPYIHLTVKTIINHCGQDFNVCLIDDYTFSKLIPGWNIDMSTLSEPLKKRARTYGLCRLLYIYGGMVVPNSFVCSKNLKPLFEMATGSASGSVSSISSSNKTNETGDELSHPQSTGPSSSSRPFIFENVNRTALQQNHQNLLFVPDLSFMGVKEKNDKTLKKLIAMLQKQLQDPHGFHTEDAFLGTNAKWCLEAISKGEMRYIGGEAIGTKTMEDGKPIGVEDLLSENYLQISPQTFGIWIPEEQILLRTKYQWFAYLTADEILHSSMAIAKYIVASIVDSSSSSDGFDENKTKYPNKNISTQMTINVQPSSIRKIETTTDSI